MKAGNQFTALGNLARDVKLAYTGNGTATARYVVAINDVYFDGQGNRQERCDFIPVTTFGKQAENDAKYLRKGSTVAVVGGMRSWFKPETKKGGIEFVASHVQYLGHPSDRRSQQGEAPAAEAPMPTGADDGIDAWLAEYDSASPLPVRR
jgi:single-strand DNA-binding protein